MRVMVAMLCMVGCVDSDRGRILVYELDEVEPVGTLDQDLCASSVGLEIGLGISESIAYEVASDGSDALLNSCDLFDDGSVSDCFILDPPVVLSIGAENLLVAQNELGITFENAQGCQGATLETNWQLTLNEDRLRTVIEAVWNLDSTEECEDFERLVIEADSRDRGIQDCRVVYDFDATLTRRCRRDRNDALICESASL